MDDRAREALTQFEQHIEANIGQRITPALAVGLAKLAEVMVQRATAKPLPESTRVSDAELEDQSQALERLLCGRQDAVKCFEHVVRLSHRIDDMYDGDVPTTPREISDVIWFVINGLHDDPFYRAHHAALKPVLVTGALNWLAANQMEATGREEELRIAHVIRTACGDVLMQMMVLTGGWGHAVENAREARLLTQGAEPWDTYLKEHAR